MQRLRKAQCECATCPAKRLQGQKKRMGFMAPNIYKLSFPQKWKPDNPERGASVTQGKVESLFCNGWSFFFFIYSYT